jgi:acylphosphatase
MSAADLIPLGLEFEARWMADSTPRPGDRTVAWVVRYSGSVQGVGFRATTANIARKYPVSGYVKNLPDGQVELYVEGQPEAVDAFLAGVRGYWTRHIDQEQVEQQKPAGKYMRFDIAR